MAIYFIVGLVGAVWAAAVAGSKNNNALGYAVLGFVLPLIGVIAAYAAAPSSRKDDHARYAPPA